jgi:TPM domain/Ring finger domain
VCDPAGVLSRHQRAVLDRVIEALHQPEDRTGDGCASSYDVGVVVIRRMSDDGRLVSVRAEAFAKHVLSNWRLGEECGNGVLLFVSLLDRRVFIATDAIAGRTLTSSNIDDAIRQMLPYFMRSDTFRAILVGMQTIAKSLPTRSRNGGAAAVAAASDHRSAPLIALEWPLMAASLAGVISLVIACLNGIGGSKRTELRKLLAPQQCAICLEPFERHPSQSRSALLAAPPSPAPKSVIGRSDAENSLVKDTSGNAQVASSGPEAVTSSDSTVLLAAGETVLGCGHMYHRHCADDWACTTGTTDCPLCTQNASASTVAESEDAELTFRRQRLRALRPDLASLLTLERPRRSCQSRDVSDADGSQYVRQQHSSASVISGIGWMLGLSAAGAAVSSMFSGGQGGGADQSYGTSDAANGTASNNLLSGIGGSGGGWASAVSVGGDGGWGGGWGGDTRSGWGGGGGLGSGDSGGTGGGW